MEQTYNDSIKVAQERTETNFPSLNTTTVAPAYKSSYAGKAEDWRKQRLETEHNEKVDAQIAAVRARKARESLEESHFLASQSPFKNRAKPVTEEKPVITAQPEDDGWTLVQKKPRKERKDKVNFDEVPEDVSIESDVVSDHDKDNGSLWY
jgi:hypothetical protein